MVQISRQNTTLMSREQRMHFSITEKGLQEIIILMTIETIDNIENYFHDSYQ